MCSSQLYQLVLQEFRLQRFRRANTRCARLDVRRHVADDAGIVPVIGQAEIGCVGRFTGAMGALMKARWGA